MLGMVGLSLGIGALQLYHMYGLPPTCIGALRWMHYNEGLIAFVFGAFLAFNPKLGYLRPIGWFFIMFGLGLIGDDVIWHYLAISSNSPNYGFNYTAGCS